jgi:hypothetical protein
MVHAGLEAQFKVLRRLMSLKKKKKCPHTKATDAEDTEHPRKHHKVYDPHMEVSDLLDNVQTEYIHESRMSKNELLSTINDVHDEYSLGRNEEQSHAFCIAAEHFAFGGLHQMLLFITAIGGSGKSHANKAIIELFKRCGCPENILLSVPTGCAAVLIDGYTIHALTFLPGGEKAAKQVELEAIWERCITSFLTKYQWFLPNSSVKFQSGLQW